jgi:hypothetical protein
MMDERKPSQTQTSSEHLWLKTLEIQRYEGFHRSRFHSALPQPKQIGSSSFRMFHKFNDSCECVLGGAMMRDTEIFEASLSTQELQSNLFCMFVIVLQKHNKILLKFFENESFHCISFFLSLFQVISCVFKRERRFAGFRSMNCDFRANMVSMKDRRCHQLKENRQLKKEKFHFRTRRIKQANKDVDV